MFTAVFYYVLGNITPVLRSSLKCIQLILCITTPLLQKYGYDEVLRPFIRDVNRLSEVLYAQCMCIATTLDDCRESPWLFMGSSV